MEVEVRVFGYLREYIQDSNKSKGIVRLELKAGTKVADVLLRLKILPGEPVLVLVNGMHADLNREIFPGDHLSVFPPLGGG